MLSVLGGLFIGVVAGAAATEVVRGQKPELLEKVGGVIKSGIDSIKSTVDSAISAFSKGYKEKDTNEPEEEDR